MTICKFCTKNRPVKYASMCGACYQKQRREAKIKNVIKLEMASEYGKAYEKELSTVSKVFQDTMYDVGLHIENLEGEIVKLRHEVKGFKEMENDFNSLLKLVHAARERFGTSEQTTLKMEVNGNLERVGEGDKKS